VKLRSAMTPQPATVYAGEGGTGTIVLDTAQNGISPGQAAVFYDGARVLGGGWIDSASLSEAAKAA
jgi:tRNA-specific 2-thiouridylase